MGTNLDQLVSSLPPQVGGQYEQIPLNNNNLFPWGDLKAAGSLGRVPVYPDDMPPVLALPYAYGPQFPRVNQCEDNGSLHVFVTNQSGGGGGSAPLVLANDGARGTHITNNSQIITSDPTLHIILHGWSWAWYANNDLSGAIDWCYIAIYSSVTSSHGLILSSVGMGGTGGTGVNTSQPMAGSGWSDRGIDIPASFGHPGYTVKAQSDSPSITVDFWMNYEVVP